MSEYNFTQIEQQAQEYWRENNSFKAVEDKNKEKFYCLSMLPYPSGTFIWDMCVIIRLEM